MPPTAASIVPKRNLGFVTRPATKIRKRFLLQVLDVLDRQREEKGLSAKAIGKEVEADQRTVRAHLVFARELGWVEQPGPARTMRWRLAYPFMIYQHDRVGLSHAAEAAIRGEPDEARDWSNRERGVTPMKYLRYFRMLTDGWDEIEGRLIGRLKALEKVALLVPDENPRLRRQLKLLEDGILEAATLRYVVAGLARRAPDTVRVVRDEERQFRDIVRRTKREFDERHKWPVMRHGKHVVW